MQNYFSVFNLPDAFDIDLAELERRYFEVQRMFHPDRMVAKLPAERQRAIAHSMLVNEAYDALKSPLKRAQHLLKLNGISVGGEQDSVKPLPSLLMQIMEIREALAEETIEKEIEKLAEENIKEKANTIAELSTAISKRDSFAAAQLTIKLGYLTKLDDEIRIKKKSLTRLS